MRKFLRGSRWVGGKIRRTQRVKVKLPQVSVPTYDLEVIGRDTTEKQKMKVYADSHQNAKPHHFRVGDPVLVKQKKSNKLSTPFDPKPYVIMKVKGSMIIAKWISDVT